MNCKNIQQPTSDIQHPVGERPVEQGETERTEGFTPRRKDAKMKIPSFAFLAS